MSRRGYGGSALHLLAHGLGFALAAYALAQVFRAGGAVSFAVWLLGAALLHDLLLLPAYSLADRLLSRAARRVARLPGAVNYVRVPALLSGLLLLIHFPMILGLSEHRYFLASGRHLGGTYARNWAFVSVALFAGAAVLYGIRALQTRSQP